jgi:DNA-directed RNA polymerase subunit N (RpoN/RPB10)
MPTGKPLCPEIRKEVKRRLREGELPEFIADEYGITRTTCHKYLAAMRDELRAKMRSEGCSDLAIEREVHRVFRHDDCQFLTMDYPGEIKSCYTLATKSERHD